MLHTILSVAAVVVSLAALGASLRGLKYLRASAEAAIRSANAAETANANRAIEEAAAAGTPIPQPAARDVQWKIQRPTKNRFLLRNTGTDVATGVTIDERSIPALPTPRGLPRGMAIRPGQAAKFTLMHAFGLSHVKEIWVWWDVQDTPVAVPVPGVPVPGW